MNATDTSDLGEDLAMVYLYTAENNDRVCFSPIIEYLSSTKICSDIPIDGCKLRTKAEFFKA